MQNELDDMGSMFTNIVDLVSWKIAIFVYLAFIVLNTSTFIDRVLSGWSGAVDGRQATEKGIMVQAVLLTMGVVAFSVLANSDLI